MGYIYKVTNTINGKIYVGQTIRTIKKRWKQHVYSAYHETKEHNAPIQYAIRKYGECAF